MKMLKLGSMALLCAALSACGIEVPADKSDYVGFWRSESGAVRLRIAQDGRVNYGKSDGNSSTEINAPIQSFDGDDFNVGMFGFKARFQVSVPPHDVGDEMRMTVDGVQLVRVDDQVER